MLTLSYSKSNLDWVVSGSLYMLLCHICQLLHGQVHDKYVQLHCYYRIHIHQTLLQILVLKISKYNLNLLCYCYISSTSIYTPQILHHICILVHVQICEHNVSVHTSYEVSVINSVTGNTGIHTYHILSMSLSKYTCQIEHTCHTALLL